MRSAKYSINVFSVLDISSIKFLLGNCGRPALLHSWRMVTWTTPQKWSNWHLTDILVSRSYKMTWRKNLTSLMAAEKSTHPEEADKWMQLKIWKIRESTSALVSKNSKKLIMRSLSEVRNGNKLIAQNIICHLEKHAFLRSYKLSLADLHEGCAVNLVLHWCTSYYTGYYTRQHVIHNLLP